MDSPICTIVIRSFNEEQHLPRLIDGIYSQTLHSKIEIILVDSGSTDKTAQIARERNLKVITIRPEEFSFGRALNIGCKEAKGKYLLFASAHVYPVYTNWVEKMLAPFENERIGLVYGKQVGNNLTKFSEQQIFKKWFPDTSNLHQSHPFCNNANAAICRVLWESQPFNESLTGLEDLDWCHKIQLKGYEVAYESQAPIVHVHEESYLKIQNRYRREAIALKRIFPEQHMSFLHFLQLCSGNIAIDFRHAIKDKTFKKNLIDIVKFRFMQFWGSYQGFNQKGQINAELRNRFYYPASSKRSQEIPQEPGEKISYRIA